MVAPFAAVLAMIVSLVVLSTADRVVSAHAQRQATRGPHWSLWLVAVLSAPGRIATAVVIEGIASAMGLLVGASAGVTLTWLWTSRLAGNGPFGETVSVPIVLAVSTFALGLTAWFGPGGTRVRRATGLVSARAARLTSGRVLTVVVTLAVVAVAVVAARSGVSQAWGPLPSPQEILDSLSRRG